MEPYRLTEDDPRLGDVLALIRTAFTAHNGRIDPPSSMHRMTLESFAQSAGSAEVWAVGAPPVATVSLTVKEQAVYLSKLAVAQHARGTGMARQLIQLAEERARALGCAALELQTRVELTENHATFATLGFQIVGESVHVGFDRPTSLIMRKTI
ncbi:MAG: GNAT family N-acetyltransferase [Paracoccaceae bacterium]